MEEKKQIICPNCHSKLTVADAPGLADKVLVCPICKYKAKVSLFLAGGAPNRRPDPKPTDNSQEDGNTIVNLGGAQNADPGQLRIEQTGQYIPLEVGQHTIGRLASNKKARILIGNDGYSDPYMSRLHARISVVPTANGGLQHRLQDAGAKNPIKHNGRVVPADAVIVLKIGDTITLGKTDFKLEPTDEEATKVVAN